jgi:ubiquitin carboxyl-terminal hydrolase 4/11/15
LTYCVANQSEQFVYDLYATSSHFGGLNGGHYTAQAKNGHQNQWYDFNDSRITPIEEKNVKSSAAYLLFYTKVSGSQQMSYNWWSNDKP